MNDMRNFFPLVSCALLFYSCAQSFEHDQKLAAKRAVEFARVVFVEREFEKGYALLSDSAKRYVPLEKFKETVIKSHPRTYPITITATDFEPMSGEKAIYIYLTGENDGEHFYYTLTLDGTAATDYSVTRFSRGGTPFGSGNAKQPLGR
jgi:hypothetical protein